MPAAMLAWPAIRKAPIARLRRVAITRGALPTRICEVSQVVLAFRRGLLAGSDLRS
jgi:hypothetical protein